jgi:hypothetical protein
MRKNKVAGYLRALDLMNKEGLTQYKACEKAGISRMTFNKYRDMLGDQVAPNKVEVLPKETAPVKATKAPKEVSELQKLIEENSVMAENLRLKKELGLIQ